ncbi:MFS transporter [bacterium]|nr:MFS transporter [bacterium]
MEFIQNNIIKLQRLKFVLRALRYRNFRIFFYGQSVSLIGTWMQTIAMSWLVFRLTGSGFLLGLVGFSTQFPAFLMSPFAGVYVDRLNRRWLVIVAQTLAMIQAFILAFLTLTGAIKVWHIIILSIFLGVIYALDIPARQAFFVDIIEKRDDLGNAIALNSLIFNGARLVGPSIAGILIAVVGEGLCFFINGLSFLAVIISLLVMKVKQAETNSRKRHFVKELREGFVYAFRLSAIRSVLIFLAVVSFAGLPYIVLMPIFAKDVLHGGPQTLGFLIAASGIGALCGAIYLASQKSVLGLGEVIAISTIIFGIGLIAFSQSRIFLVSSFLLLFIGGGMMIFLVGSNIILQTIVDEDKRGRVMSFFTMAFMGMEPLGSLVAGSLSSAIGAPKTIMAGGIVCILGSIFFARNLNILRESILPLYEKMDGISEAVSEG